MSERLDTLMPIEHIDDWQQRIRRQDAFWRCEVIDRPVCCITVPKDKPVVELPPKPDYPNHRTRWFDAERRAAECRAGALNNHWLGDALPTAFPNLGPEVFSAFFGTPMEYGETTSWTEPNLLDWSRADELQFSRDNLFWKKLVEMTDTLVELGRGTYYTGITDLHPGGDAIAAFRDPAQFAIDLLERPDDVKRMVDRVTDVFGEVFGFFADRLLAAGQAITSWPGIVSSKKWYVPSNDFSIMISKGMFDDVFLSGIARECRLLDASIYHLDGPGALRHLDSLLSIPELNAIQWVYGAGNGRTTDWLHVHKKCQAAGKGVQLNLEADEVDTVIDQLKPEGVWMRVVGVETVDQGEAILKRVTQWT